MITTKKLFDMPKQQVKIERELKSNSQNIIWNLISEPDQLARWLADDIQKQGDLLNFRWGELYAHHETRQAKVVAKVKFNYLRFRWLDEEDADAYVELRMEKCDVTDDYILVITDFADDDDVDTFKDLWEDNLLRLRQFSGL